MNSRNDGTSSGLRQNGRRPGGQVCVYTLFEVEGELGMRQQVGIPGAASRGSPRDVHLPRNMVEPYLDAACHFGVASGNELHLTAKNPSLLPIEISSIYVAVVFLSCTLRL